ncbi:MAG TPA: hypothetical protein VJ725_18350 [Thermoanaerobaculia bacterium]|nr:hypothetical protein [Thermoanaerobaculia bacterium]
MSLLKKLFLIAAGFFAVIVLGSGLLLAGTVAVGGLVTVKVEEQRADGTDLYIPVPAAFLDLGLALVPDEELAQVQADLRRDLGDWGPAVAASLDAFADCPDGLLLEAQDGAETVRIEKRGRSFLVHVNDGETEVRVSVPARFVGRVARLIA